MDWGQAVGVPTVVHLFCLRLRARGVCFAKAFPTEKLEAFLARPYRREHDDFAHLRAHYLFESHFCNPARAQKIRAAENLVGYVRRNALVPVQDFASWEELNAHLLDWCHKDRARRPGWPPGWPWSPGPLWSPWTATVTPSPGPGWDRP